MSFIWQLEDHLRREDVQSSLAAIFDDGKGSCLRLVERAQSVVENLFVAERKIWCRRDIDGVRKCLDSAELEKDRGAKLVKTRKYIEASEAYSQALLKTPLTNTAGRARASTLLANRALCLLKANSGDLNSNT